MPLRYLTLQDVLWINLQVSKKVHHFQAARLEEAVFCQYSLGIASGLDKQSARLFNGLLKLKAFDFANEATAFVACGALLLANGQEITLTDEQVPAWISPMIHGKVSMAGGISNVISAVELSEHQDMRASIVSILEKYPCSIEQLVEASAG